MKLKKPRSLLWWTLLKIYQLQTLLIIEVKFAKIETTTDTDLTDVIPVKVKATLAPIPKINPSLTKTKEMQEYEKEEFYKRGDTRSQAKKDL